jgi:hypothetical protein
MCLIRDGKKTGARLMSGETEEEVSRILDSEEISCDEILSMEKLEFPDNFFEYAFRTLVGLDEVMNPEMSTIFEFLYLAGHNRQITKR